jgi:hypothetical protein
MFTPTILRRRWAKIALALYLSGFLICELLQLGGAYESGGFDRPHTLTDLAVIGMIYLAAGLLWPAVGVIVILQLLGLLPHPIDL